METIQTTDFRSMLASVRGVDTQRRTISAIASTKSVDRAGEVIEPSAFGGSIDDFRQNPVLLAGHVYASETGEPTVIGKVEQIRVTGEGLPFSARFAETPLAAQYWQLYEGGFMRAFSVGFIPRRSEMRSVGGEMVRTHTEVELLEVSAVAVPANRDALVRAAQTGNAAASFMLDTLPETPVEKAQPTTAARSRLRLEKRSDRAGFDAALKSVADEIYSIRDDEPNGDGKRRKLQAAGERILELRARLADPRGRVAKALLDGGSRGRAAASRGG
jgi:HK97 family phage prohead protease